MGGVVVLDSYTILSDTLLNARRSRGRPGGFCEKTQQNMGGRARAALARGGRGRLGDEGAGAGTGGHPEGALGRGAVEVRGCGLGGI